MVPSRWAVRRERPAVVALVALVAGLAALATVGVTVISPELLQVPAGPWPNGGQPALVVAAALFGAAVVHHEFIQTVERARRGVSNARVINFTGVWTFGAVLALPPAWAILVIVSIYAYVWTRVWRSRTPLYRVVFNASSVVLAAMAAAGAVAGARMLAEATGTASPEPLAPWAVLSAVLAAMLVYAGVQQTIVVGVMTLAVAPAERTAVQRLSGEEYLMQVATLGLGALTAAVVVEQPLLVVLVPPALVVMARATLVRELREAVERDARTGLLTSEAWHARAQLLLPAEPDAGSDTEPGGGSTAVGGAAAEPRWAAWFGRRRGGPESLRALGVLMVDVDHFKAINDTYGHPVGDVVLQEVAQALRAAVRATDLVARYGGEEFLILLADDGGPVTDRDRPDLVLAVAEQVRSRVAALRVSVPTPDGPLTTTGPITVSVGAVVVEGPATGLAAIVAAADAAVYAAKRAGRDCVRLSGLRPRTR